ncbi:hypothetical protein J6590_049416 [Homalodisca vitripennis]|nr:hypothetical protein J6590_049416 [Homalodisca vitripennis]
MENKLPRDCRLALNHPVSPLNPVLLFRRLRRIKSLHWSGNTDSSTTLGQTFAYPKKMFLESLGGLIAAVPAAEQHLARLVREFNRVSDFNLESLSLILTISTTSNLLIFTFPTTASMSSQNADTPACKSTSREGKVEDEEYARADKACHVPSRSREESGRRVLIGSASNAAKLATFLPC